MDHVVREHSRQMVGCINHEWSEASVVRPAKRFAGLELPRGRADSSERGGVGFHGRAEPNRQRVESGWANSVDTNARCASEA